MWRHGSTGDVYRRAAPQAPPTEESQAQAQEEEEDLRPNISRSFNEDKIHVLQGEGLRLR